MQQGSETDTDLVLSEHRVWVEAANCTGYGGSRVPGQAECRMLRELRTESLTHTGRSWRDPQGRAFYTETGIPAQKRAGGFQAEGAHAGRAGDPA